MAGIYIHIPFCKKACSYCNFYFVNTLTQKNNYIDSICIELKIRALDYRFKIKTLYFGGGTPSLLDEKDFQKILNIINDNYDISELEEFTIEANPDDISLVKLLEWEKLGINRLSIGIQSFSDDELLLMNRVHNSSNSISSLELATNIFQNISTDFIFNMPDSNLKKIEKNLSQFLKFDIKHISAYNLTYEEKTKITKLKKANIITPLDDLNANEQFIFIKYFLESNNFLHYEISNYSKLGFESKHNSAYWNGENCLGIGVSSHSLLNKNLRQINISNINNYIKSILSNKIYYTIEKLSIVEQYNEYILTKIRTAKGIDFDYISKNFSLFKNSFTQNINNLISLDLIFKKNNHYFLTSKGMLISDWITGELIEVKS